MNRRLAIRMLKFALKQVTAVQPYGEVFVCNEIKSYANTHYWQRGGMSATRQSLVSWIDALIDRYGTFSMYMRCRKDVHTDNHEYNHYRAVMVASMIEEIEAGRYSPNNREPINKVMAVLNKSRATRWI